MARQKTKQLFLASGCSIHTILVQQVCDNEKANYSIVYQMSTERRITTTWSVLALTLYDIHCYAFATQNMSVKTDQVDRLVIIFICSVENYFVLLSRFLHGLLRDGSACFAFKTVFYTLVFSFHSISFIVILKVIDPENLLKIIRWHWTLMVLSTVCDPYLCCNYVFMTSATTFSISSPTITNALEC